MVNEPTQNEEYNNISKEILQLVNEIKSNRYQRNMAQTARSAALSAGKHAHEARIEFSIDGKDYKKFQELSNKLHKISAEKIPTEPKKSPEFTGRINLTDKQLPQKLSTSKALSLGQEEILRSKFLYLDNAEDFTNSLQNLFENLEKYQKINQRDLEEILKKVERNSIQINTKYSREIRNDLDSQYQMLLEEHINEISGNIQHILKQYIQYGEELHNQVFDLSKNISKELKNISNLIRETEVTLQNQMDKMQGNYKPSLETIPEDVEATFNPSQTFSPNDLWIKLENSFTQLEKFTDKNTINIPSFQDQSSTLNNIYDLDDSGISSGTDISDSETDLTNTNKIHLEQKSLSLNTQKNIKPELGKVDTKASSPRQTDIEQIVPDIKRLFGEHHVPQKDIEPLVTSVRNLFKASSPKQADVEQIMPDIKRLFGDIISKN
ncbi:hypothetical protein NOVO_07835 [Rickettsiales bacterium Ac37b]|nr:hypothetical protein NOVO_07835 [Rickettsiales bacterium Ac37b]